MKLFCSLTSPYARKVRVAIRERGLVSQVEEVLVDPWADPPQLLQGNPLGKVPALLTREDVVLPDSRLILDYLLPEPQAPSATADRWNAVRRTQLADGVIDSTVAMVVETRKRPPEYRWQGWLDRQEKAIARTLDALEAEAGALRRDRAGHCEIALGCALEYLILRFPSLDWRSGRPGLVGWHSAFAARQSMIDTRPPAA